MPRRPTIRSRNNYYHITARSNNREYFYLPISNVWNIMTSKLADIQNRLSIKISAFVLMNNHFHLLILTPKEDIDRVMYFFMKEVTFEIQKSTGRINKIFGGRYKACLIDNWSYLINVYKYIYRNPIESSLSNQAEAYHYSTLYFSVNKKVQLPFKLDKFSLPHIFEGQRYGDELKWINQKYGAKESASIKCGLHKTRFAYKKDRISNQPIKPLDKYQNQD